MLQKLRACGPSASERENMLEEILAMTDKQRGSKLPSHVVEVRRCRKCGEDMYVTTAAPKRVNVRYTVVCRNWACKAWYDIP